MRLNMIEVLAQIEVIFKAHLRGVWGAAQDAGNGYIIRWGRQRSV